MSQVSCRRSALRVGNEAGKFAGMLRRGQTPRMTRDHARHLADYAAGDHAVPEHWRPLFVRAFVKAALHAAHTDRDVGASSKYGVA